MMLKKVIPLAMVCVFIAGGNAFGASPDAHYKISGTLNKAITNRAVSLAKKSGIAGSDKRKIIFYTKDTTEALKYIKSHGGGILKRKKNLIIANVSLDKVEDLVGNERNITYARFPCKFLPCGIISEGVNVTGANTLQNAGLTGKGVKIAVIDMGFKGLSAAIANGELPSNIQSQDFSGKGLETQYKHGTACAEIIYDMAPDAELYLLKIYDEADIYSAADYCKSNGIDIVSMSIGTFGTGPGNGTGSMDEICDDLKASGILIIAAAGNEANTQAGDGTPIGTHWQGPFIGGGNGDSNTHQFISGDSQGWFNVIYAEPYKDDDGVSQMNDITIIMRWNDWPSASVDYDMYLYNYSSGVLVGSSASVQNGSQPPLEEIVIDIPDTEAYKLCYLVVKKKSGSPAGKDIEILLGGNSCFIPPFGHSSSTSTSSSSILEPADAESVLAVGAINQSSWATGPQEDFSSQGPTNAWAGSSARIKPDICGPDRTSSYTYGTTSFPGTSAATPHVAGAAALILSMHPQYTVDQLRLAIEQNAIDMGSSGKDNTYGNGKLKVDRSLNTLPILDWTGEAGYVNDGLEPETGNSLTPLTFKIKYTDINGDAPAVYDLYIDRNGDGDYADTGEIVSMTPTGSDYKSGVIYTCVTNIPYSSGSSNCSYYFKFSDGVDYATGNITGAISSQTAINRPDIFQSLSLAIDRANWQLPGIPAGSEHVTDNSNKIIVTNNGDGPETYSLRIVSEGNGWSASASGDGVDINKYVLSAVFSATTETSIDSSYFNETASEDVISAAGIIRASQTLFGSTRFSAGGFSVPVGADRNLWLEFKAPIKDTAHAIQAISLIINAEAQ
ncbi:MAG: S8 family serine peptidase [Candidatus Omnitrophica bacterium]|nr:S8 family serine peptidase [Candidatus Omnitrophota bacterium]